MTTWAPFQIAKYAQVAGFTRAEIIPAVAVSWTATSGADHTERNQTTVGDLGERGLWGIRKLHLTDEQWDAQLDPLVAAHSAWFLHQLHKGGWEWHYAWRTPQYRRDLDFVRAALERPGSWQTSRHGSDFGQAIRQAAVNAIKLRDATR
jgi:hypothetical protein